MDADRCGNRVPLHLVQSVRLQPAQEQDVALPDLFGGPRDRPGAADRHTREFRPRQLRNSGTRDAQVRAVRAGRDSDPVFPVKYFDPSLGSIVFQREFARQVVGAQHQPMCTADMRCPVEVDGHRSLIDELDRSGLTRAAVVEMHDRCLSTHAQAADDRVNIDCLSDKRAGRD
jgi:hypothetical protein